MQFFLSLLASLLIVGDASRVPLNFQQDDYNNYEDQNIKNDYFIGENLQDLNYKPSSSLNLYGDDSNLDYDSKSNKNFFYVDINQPGDDGFSVEKKSARLRSYAQVDRGNRDMIQKFKKEMVQCKVVQRPVNLTDVFGKNGDVQFHESHHNLHESECVLVEDNDDKQVEYPCLYFPSGAEHICYARNKCETLKKLIHIWMHNGQEWFSKPHQILVGCQCNSAFVHH